MKIKQISNGTYSGGDKPEQRLFALSECGRLFVLVVEIVSSDPFANWPKTDVWKEIETPHGGDNQ